MTVSVAAKANAGAGSVVGPPGPETTSGAAGGVTSTVNARVAGDASTLPDASRARTANVCAPSASAAGVNGDAHGAGSAPSSEHENSRPGLVGAEREGRRGVVDRALRAGLDRRVGHARVDHEGLRRRRAVDVAAASTARTSKVCGPSPSAAVVCGEVQGAKATASTRHWNVAPGLGGERERRRLIAGRRRDRRQRRVRRDVGRWSKVCVAGRGVVVARGVDGAHLRRCASPAVNGRSCAARARRRRWPRRARTGTCARLRGEREGRRGVVGRRSEVRVSDRCSGASCRR